MSRSGYSDDDGAELNLWRGAVESAIRGKRGQAFLHEMLVALDALPEPRLIAEVLVNAEGCCAIGAVALKRQISVADLDSSDRRRVAATFGISPALAAEIAYINDEDTYFADEETPEQRFARVREWVVGHLLPAAPVTEPEREP